MATNRCYDPKAIILVELEPAAVVALLDDSHRDLKDWDESPHPRERLPGSRRARLLAAQPSSPPTSRQIHHMNTRVAAEHGERRQRCAHELQSTAARDHTLKRCVAATETQH